MQLKEIMTRDVEFVSPEDSIGDVAQKMKEEDTGALPVCDGDRIRGMITDRDIVIRALAEGKEPGSLKASDVMSKEVHYCYEDEDVSRAASLMQRKQVRRLIVLNRKKRIVGLLSLGDLAMHSGKPELAGQTLREISGPSSPQSYYKELKKTPQRFGWASALMSLGIISGLFGLGYSLFVKREEGFISKLRERFG